MRLASRPHRAAASATSISPMSTRPLPAGFMVEVLPDVPEMHAFFGVVRSAAEDWDRRTPWREMS